MADDVQNLQIQQQINQAIQARAVLMDANTRRLTAQVQLSLELCKAMACEDLDRAAERLGDIQAGLQGASTAAAQMGPNMTAAAAGGEEASESFQDLTKHINATTGAAIGAGFGISNAWESVKGRIAAVASFISSVAQGIMGIGTAILAAPFSMLKGLIGMAYENTGGGNALREAFEAVRETFGSLATNEGKALKSSVKGVRNEFASLTKAGPSFARVYGYGRAGVAAQLKETMEIAEALGSTFGLLADHISKNSAAIGFYKRSLGLTADAMAALGKRAVAAGRDLAGDDSVLAEMASLAVQLGDKFNINSKIISKNMQEMTVDFSNFGSMSQKELAATAVFASKLGVEIEDMMGVIDKFDNFEDAAKGAAELAQSFGLNVDAMKLMNAQSPAERVDILRKAFFAAGQTMEGMTRQERKLLETQTGLAGSALDAAFANENMGLSYEEITASADAAEKKQLTQAEAMEKLADSIEKTFAGGGRRFSSFFDALSQGFMRGIMRSRPFMKLFRNLRRVLKQTYWFGRTLGRMFVNLFPGVKQFTQGLSDLFDPKRWKKMFTSLKKTFTEFFGKLNDGDYIGAVEGLLEGIKTTFWKYFDSDAPGGIFGNMKEGFKDALLATIGIISSLLPVAIKEITKLLKGMTSFISGPSTKDPKTDPPGMFVTNLEEMLRNLSTTLEPLVPELWEAFKNLFRTLWREYGKPFKKYIVAGLVVIIGGAISALALSMGSGAFFGGILGNLFGGAKKETEKVTGTGDPYAQQGMVREQKGFMSGLGDLMKAMGDMTPRKIENMSGVFRAISRYLVPVLITLAGASGLGLLAAQFNKIDFMDLVKGIAAFAVVAAVIGGLILATAYAGDMDLTTILQGFTVIAGIMLVGLPIIAAGAYGLSVSLPRMLDNMKGFGPKLKEFGASLPGEKTLRRIVKSSAAIGGLIGILALLTTGVVLADVARAAGGATVAAFQWIREKAGGPAAAAEGKKNPFARFSAGVDMMVEHLPGILNKFAGANIKTAEILPKLHAINSIYRAFSLLVEDELDISRLSNALFDLDAAVRSMLSLGPGLELLEQSDLAGDLEKSTIMFNRMSDAMGEIRVQELYYSADTLNSAAQSLHSAVGLLIRIDVGKGGESMVNLYAMMDQMQIFEGLDIAEVQQGAELLGEGLRAMDHALSGMKGISAATKAIPGLNHMLDDMITLGERFVDYRSAGASAIVVGFNEIAAEIIAINKALAENMPIVEVQSVITKFAKVMKSKTDVFKIKTKAINMKINFKVIMEAEKVAKALANPKVIVNDKTRLISVHAAKEG